MNEAPLSQMKVQKVRKIDNPNGDGDICSYCREPIKWHHTTCVNCRMVLGQKYVSCPKCEKGYPAGTTSCRECEAFAIPDVSTKGGIFAKKLLDPENPGGSIKSDLDEVFYKYDLPESNKFQFMEYIFCIACCVNRKAWDSLGQEKADSFMDGFLFIIFKFLSSDQEEAEVYFDIYNKSLILYGLSTSLEKGYEFVDKKNEAIGMLATGLIGIIQSDSKQAHKVSNEEIQKSLFIAF